MKNTKLIHDFSRYVTMNVLGMLGLSCYILADTFFISSKLGVKGLTALNLAIPIYSFIHGSGLMFGMGGATRYAILKGQKNTKEQDRVFTNTIWMGLLLGAVFLFAGIFLSGTITGLLGANQQVFEMTQVYLKVILMFAPMFVLNEMILCFVRNDGKPQLSMAAMLTGSLSNIVLDYIFLFPCGMGIFGAVLATGLAPVISMMVMLPHLIQRKQNFHLVKMRPGIRLGKDAVWIGLPSLITELSSGTVIIVFNLIILKIAGNTGVAAYGVIANLSLVVTAVYTGIAQGIQPMLSESYGKGDIPARKLILRYAVFVSLLVSVLVYAGIFFQAGAITDVFNSEGNTQLADMAEKGLRIYFMACVPLGINIIAAAYFSSMEQTFPAQLVSILRGFLFIVPLSFVLSGIFRMTGVWMAYPVTEILTFFVTVICCLCVERRQRYQKK